MHAPGRQRDTIIGQIGDKMLQGYNSEGVGKSRDYIIWNISKMVTRIIYIFFKNVAVRLIKSIYIKR